MPSLESAFCCVSLLIKILSRKPWVPPVSGMGGPGMPPMGMGGMGIHGPPPPGMQGGMGRPGMGGGSLSMGMGGESAPSYREKMPRSFRVAIVEPALFSNA